LVEEVLVVKHVRPLVRVGEPDLSQLEEDEQVGQPVGVP
jgi:hypothetical protein